MNVTFESHEVEFAAYLRSMIVTGLQAAAEETQALVMMAISNPPPPSKPGEPPHVESGDAYASVSVQEVGAVSAASGVTYRVGYPHDTRYMGMHESGINYKRVGFQQRKSLEPSVLKGKSEIAAAFLSASEGGIDEAS